MIISGPEMLMGYTTECLPGETQGAAVFSVTVRKPLHLVFPAASDSPPIPMPQHGVSYFWSSKISSKSWIFRSNPDFGIENLGIIIINYVVWAP